MIQARRSRGTVDTIKQGGEKREEKIPKARDDQKGTKPRLLRQVRELRLAGLRKTGRRYVVINLCG